MINKKNVLGKTPDELGAKDAIHTAIVAVRAGHAMEPGTKCSLNEDREAVASNSKSLGVADPFRKGTILRGQSFWLLLGQAEVPNVQHVWDIEGVDFSPPTKEPTLNRTIKEVADMYGVTYEQIMEAAQHAVDKDRAMPYPGEKDLDEIDEDELSDIMYEFWSEWADEVLYEFENYGSACCPEYQHPECGLYTK